MRSPVRTLSVTLGVVLVACGDGGTEPSASSFTGSWHATKLEYVSVANPSTKVDVIGQGATLTVQFNGGGGYTSTLTMPGEAQEITTGTWEASVDVFTMRWTEGAFTNEMQFDWTMSGSTLTLVGATSDFDFAGTGELQPAKLNVTLVRQ